MVGKYHYMIKEFKLNDLLIAEKANLVNRLQAIDVLLGNIKPSIKSTLIPHSIKIPLSYDSNLTWEDKCLYIIHQKESIYSAGIVIEALKYEPDVEKDKISKSIAQALVRLKKDNKVVIPNVSGRKYNYEINKKLSLLN
jgi:hypothetical protein